MPLIKFHNYLTGYWIEPGGLTKLLSGHSITKIMGMQK